MHAMQKESQRAMRLYLCVASRVHTAPRPVGLIDCKDWTIEGGAWVQHIEHIGQDKGSTDVFLSPVRISSKLMEVVKKE